MKKILFDSDVLIERFRGRVEVEREIRDLASEHAVIAYTPITVAEIYRGLRSNEREKVELFLGTFTCLEINRAVGKRAGEYLKTYSRSHGLELADALIAATAFVYDFQLCTFNWKHYPMSDIDKYRLI